MAYSMNNAFIIGTGRCGTSWLGQMLNSHAEVCVPPEIQLLFEYSGNGDRLFEAFSQAGPSGLDGELIASIIKQGCPHKLEMFFDYAEFCCREDTPRSSAAVFVEAFYAAIAKAHGKTWLIEQTPWYGQRLDLVSRIFPNAKFIHVVRDGRDVALSFARTPWWHASPRLNLSRWQREIKKIALDAAFYLDASAYLEVKYESLVANTEFELERICEFLGIDFDPCMLNPKKLIDYDQFCKFDMKQVSSQVYSDWRQRKDSTSFSENVGAWQRAEGMFLAPLPPQIASWLSHYGYEIERDSQSEVDVFQYHQEYSFNALERELASQKTESARLLDVVEQQISHNSALQDELTRQVEHAQLVEQDWLARGELIQQHSITLESQINHNRLLQEELATQSQHIHHLEEDWVARGELIGQHSKTLEMQASQNFLLQEELANLSRHTQCVEQDWAARGDLIEQQSSSLETQIGQYLILQEALVKQSQHIQLLEQDWAARGNLIEQHSISLESQISQNLILQEELVKQSQHIQRVEQDWAARGDLIEEHSISLKSQISQNLILQEELAKQSQHIQRVEQDWTARGHSIAQLSENLQAQVSQISLLERDVMEKAEHIQFVEQELAAREELIKELLNTISALQMDNTVLKECVENARNDIGKLEVELDGFRNSWCGRLKSFLKK
ncbi:sulfotransferase family protein [Pseudomonas sp. A-R-26]|uniref:sulfotransferase family protein n=1 Tax=Pseudomonas sp. A-R-26 TaxID=2832404 RepID=UPI001CBDD02F|nr:sulfotransferase [Pseudomonas sp. A-R-26]